MPHLALRLLGPTLVTLDGRQVERFGYEKVLALLVYLAVEADRAHRRDALGELLWPDRPQGVARNNLRQALVTLRQTIGDTAAQPPFLRTTRGSLQLNPASDYSCDVSAATALWSSVASHKHPPGALCQGCVAQLQQVVELYRDDFFQQAAGCDSLPFEEWASIWRERLHQQVLAALGELALYHEQHAAWAQLRAVAQRQLALEPWRESAHRHLMLALALLGERGAALAQYEQCRRTLADELGVEPDATTTALYDQIRAGVIAPPAVPFAPRSAPPPSNLPAPPAPLIGREWEIANALALLRREETRIVSLTGPGGTGKTRLAVQLAAELDGEFADGIFFVALAPLADPQLVAATIAQTIGVRETTGQTLEAQLAGYLRDRSTLLVLDNFEHLLAARPLLAALLVGAPALKMLITSRSTLRLSGEREFAVPPLRLPTSMVPLDRLGQYEAVQLFVERAQALKADFALTTITAPLVAEICRRLDGLPLAIELAAARVKLFTLPRLLDRLDSPLRFLTVAAHDQPTRHQTLRATIDWSYRLLAADEQRLFVRLAIFVGGASLEVAEAVCGDATTDVVRLIESLLDQNLVRCEEGADGELRLVCLETIREYAWEQLVAAEELPDLRRRHATCFLELAERARTLLFGPEQGRWLTHLEAELGNLRAALEWCKAHDPEAGLRLAAALWPFWEMRGYYREGRAWLEELLRLGALAEPRSRAEALRGAGVLTSLQGEYERAIALLDQALLLYRAGSDDIGSAHTLRNLGLTSWFRGEEGAARAQLESSLALFRAAKHTWGTADALHFLGHVVLDSGAVDAARALFEESLTLFRATGDQRNIALPLKDLGLIDSQHGDYQTALALYEESLALSRAGADVWHVADTLLRLGDLARLREEYERAETHYQESLGGWQRLGAKGGVAETMNLLGHIALRQGHNGTARRYYEESLAMQRDLGSKRVVADLLYSLGQLAWHEGKAQEAHERYHEALALNVAVGYLPGIADCLVGAAELLATHGQAARGAHLLAAAEPYLGQMRGFMPLADRWAFERAVAATRSQMSGVLFAHSWAAGQALTLAQAASEAQGIQLVDGRLTVAATDPATTHAPLSMLTQREAEVLRLVAQGLSDLEVAQALVISPRTVHGHLRSIYAKLGVNSRTAAARLALVGQPH